jgi:hypothetical protein
MIKKLFGGKKDKYREIFLAINGVPLDDIDLFDQYVISQVIAEEDAKQLDDYVKLSFDEKGILKDIFIKSFGEIEDVAEKKKLLINNGIINSYKLPNFQINKYFEFYLDDNGINKIGGEPITNFVLPENECPNSFQQIAFINHKDQAFSWLPFDLNIICPIYLGFDKIWLDYSIPLKPSIVNLDELNNTYSDGILKTNTLVKFEQKSFSTKASSIELYGLGFSGASNSAQGECAPRCLKTNNVMKLVGQFNSSNEIKVTEYELADGFENYHEYYEQMAFSVDCSLFVFFEPNSKLMCLTITS